MKLHRIKASALHSWYHLAHSMETWVDLYWFSLIDILVYGLISAFFISSSGDARFLVAGITIWEIVRIGQYTITIGMLWEVWSKSFSSLFISPLTFWEFIVGQAFSGLLKSISVIVMTLVVAYFVFGFSVFSLGWVFILYFLMMYVFAVAAGLFVMSLIIRFGTDIQSLAWGLIFILQPISAVFYPVDALPLWVQKLSFLSPITYVMESVRSQLSVGAIRWDYVLTSGLLTLVYVVLAVLGTNRAVRRSKEAGEFARMGD